MPEKSGDWEGRQGCEMDGNTVIIVFITPLSILFLWMIIPFLLSSMNLSLLVFYTEG